MSIFESSSQFFNGDLIIMASDSISGKVKAMSPGDYKRTELLVQQ